MRGKRRTKDQEHELFGVLELYLDKKLGRFEPKKALDKQGLSKQKHDAFSSLCAGRDSKLTASVHLLDILFRF